MEIVSVIVPVSRQGQWVDACLESIAEQDYPAIDLIRIDDRDGSGAAATRNRGLERPTGEYIAFVDDDDLLEPGAISALVAGMDGVDFVAGSFCKFGDFSATVAHEGAVLDRMALAAYAMENLRSPAQNQMLSGCWAKLYRRSLCGRFPPLTTAEDMAFNFDYFTRCKRARFIPNLVYANRKHSNSLTTTFDPSNQGGLFGFLTALREVKRFLAPYYPEAEIEDALDSSKTYHAMLYFMRICQYEANSDSFSDITGLTRQSVMRDTFKKLYP